ncbi:LytR C-terminal domain-containing protein [Arthrobacter sp. FW306-05-C]|uniref:LytR C-terminal domain-containing protein n=1 Tax=unclassified Arthrobacter TaxID=235627 RepID=UPI001EEFADB6|nr:MULTISPECIES: LytR C-terminal domain-containing protein [unclassified Arthrobacter]UKA67535.1 LytR C-terminal domain-containing protein [Arthrobacter sp. FW306-05-C]UKA76229.1 LytR C-terminal domain-containing protein [Arthrobacter sp. FW306-07-I]
MTRYARDEFDKVPETASRQGVHRTASAPSRVRLWPILAVGVAALAIGLVSFLILPKLGFNTTASQASATVESAPLAGTGSTPSPTLGSSAPASAPAPSASAEPTQGSGPEPTPSATQQAVVDKTQAVAVYNAAGTAGLASRVGGTVQADGWRLGQVGNWSGAPQKSSVIFYAGPQQLASAQELAGLLNIPTVVNSTEFQVPLVVVLGPGYR